MSRFIGCSLNFAHILCGLSHSLYHYMYILTIMYFKEYVIYAMQVRMYVRRPYQ